MYNKDNRLEMDRETNRKCMQKRRKEKPLDNKIVTKRAEAKKVGLDFNITKEDLIVPERCPYLDIPLILSGPVCDNLISLDRIDSTKGYVKGNVQVISMKANTMKSNASIEELKLFAKNILRIHGD